MIRSATADDLPVLRTIQQTSLDEPWPDLLEPAIQGPPTSLVVTTDDQPVGYAVAIPEGETAYIAEFAVAPGHRSAGHGSALMSALLDRLAADGFSAARLTVRVGDRRARSFYADHGFRARSLVPNHYEDDDGLQLVRSL